MQNKFGGTLAKVNNLWHPKYIKTLKKHKLQYMAAPLTPLHNTPVVNHSVKLYSLVALVQFFYTTVDENFQAPIGSRIILL